MRLSALIELLFPPRETERLVRAAEPDALHALAAPATFPGGARLLPYRDPLVRAFVVEAKYYGNAGAARALGEVLADYLLERAAEEQAFGPRPVTLVPVPLGPKRRRTRGYNQAEEICKAAALRLDSVSLLPGALVRTRDTAAQTSLSGEDRRKNLAGAFAAGPGIDPEHTYIVADDVVTTGATLAEAMVALRAAGAARVESVALAG